MIDQEFTMTVRLKRKRYIKTDRWRDELYDEIHPQSLVESTGTAANLVSSKTNHEDVHLPVLDLDFPCELIKSSTEGHFHLYLNKPLSWQKYATLLTALEEAEILERGWVRQAFKDKQTFVRTRETRKNDSSGIRRRKATKNKT